MGHTDSISGLPESRIPWVDMAKGAMIILVVFGHVWRGLNLKDMVPSGAFDAVDSRIYAFHMPAFFALAGWFFVSSLNKAPLAGFIRSRLIRLFWPLVLWTYIFLSAKLLAGPYTNVPATPGDLLVLPVPGLFHMWFLWALLLLSLSFSLLKPVLAGGKIPGTVVWLLIAVVIPLQFVPLPDSLNHWAGQAVRYAPFFLMGVIAGQQSFPRPSLPYPRATATLVFTAVLAVWPVLTGTALTLAGSLVLCACILFLFASSGAASASLAGGKLVLLGAASLPIYLAHTIFSAGLRETLLVCGTDSLPLHIVLGTLAGLAGPLVLLKLAQKTDMVRALGF